MKQSTEDLLLATEVRKLAVKLRHDEWTKAWAAHTAARDVFVPNEPIPASAALDQVLNERSRKDHEARQHRMAADNQYQDDWHKAHPVVAYVPKAMQLIGEVADEIGRIRPGPSA